MRFCPSCGKNLADGSKFCEFCGAPQAKPAVVHTGGSGTAGYPAAAAPARSLVAQTTEVEQQTRQMAMFLHLSVLAGFIVPFAGLIVPILIWQMKKDELPLIDVHGKNVVNWIISALIYTVICFILWFVLIGIPLSIALGLIGIIFPIIGAIKGNNGEVWKYPLTISFLK